MSNEPKLSYNTEAILKKLSLNVMTHDEAVVAFSEIKEVDELINLVCHWSHRVHEPAAKVLESRIREEHLPALIRCLEFDRTNPQILGSLLTPYSEIVFPELVEIIRDVEKPINIRGRALWAIQGLKNPYIFKFYEELLDIPEPILRSITIKGIAKSNATNVNEVLLRALKRESDLETRRYIYSVFGEMKDVALFDSLIEGLQSDDVDTQRTIIHSLWRLGDARAVDYLLPLLETPKLQRSIVSGVWKYNDVRIIPALIDLFNQQQDKTAFIRQWTMLSLNHMDAPELHVFYLPLLHDEDEAIRIGAAYGLAKMGDKQGLPQLLEGLKNLKGKTPKDEIWGFSLPKITQAFVILKDKTVIQPLINALDYNINIADVCLALGEFGDKRAVPALICQLKSKNVWNRASAAIALGELKAWRAIRHLEEIARHDKTRYKEQEVSELAQTAINQIRATKRPFFFWM